MVTSYLRDRMREKKNDAARWEQEQTECVGKKKYASYREAERNVTRKPDTKNRGRFSVYKCRICYGYHLGKSLNLSIKNVKADKNNIQAQNDVDYEPDLETAEEL